MIIQINATVCAAVDHGEDWRYKIAGDSQPEDDAGRLGKGGYQAKYRI